MSLTIALQSALSGLNAQQKALQIASNNISNANTEGYTRKTVDMSSRVVNGSGAGVNVDRISRTVDEFLLGEIRDQKSTSARLEIMDQFLSEVQNFFGSPDSGRSISGRITELQSAMESVALTPESDANRVLALNEAVAVGDQLNDLSSMAQRLRSDADREISRVVGLLNTELEKVAELNAQISRANVLGQPDGDLRDKRDLALKKVAEYLDVRTIENSDNQVSIFTRSGTTLVYGGTAQTVSHNATASLGPTVSYLDPSNPSYPGAIEGIFVGTPDTTNGSNDITGDIGNGRIRGLIDMRDTTLANLQSEIDELTQTLTEAVNAAHNAGTSVPAPNTLTSTHSFVGGDVFSAAGSVRIALLNADNTVAEVADIALGALTSVTDVINAINGAFAGVTATLVNGKLVIDATNGAQGIAINESTSAVDVTGGSTRGFSHYFGMNDMFADAVNNSDYNSYASAQVDSSYSNGTAGTLTFTNAGGAIGAVAYAAGDSLETIATNISALAGLTATVVPDGSGERLVVASDDSSNFQITDNATLLSNTGTSINNIGKSAQIQVRANLQDSPALLARATLSTTAVVGGDGVAVGDGTAASAIAAAFDTNLSFNRAGGIESATNTLAGYGSTVVSLQASVAASASNDLDYSDQFLNTLEIRNGSTSGVNIDEELASLVVLEQAFNASARVITVTAELLDEVIGLVR